ncbi:putative ribonuclease H-like domain-containing protein [Tanacetum coccineum]
MRISVVVGASTVAPDGDESGGVYGCDRSNVNTSSFNINNVKAKQPINTSNSNRFSPVRPQVIIGGEQDQTPIIIVDPILLELIATSDMDDRGKFESGCSGHMTGNNDNLDEFEECKGGTLYFGVERLTKRGKGEDKKLEFNDLKMPDENQILLQVPRQHNMYSFDMKTNLLSQKDYACLMQKPHLFSWIFFLATKDETSGILQNFFRQIENQLNHRVKIIRSDNGTEFKNRDMLEFCGNKGIKQEYSNARTPQQNEKPNGKDVKGIGWMFDIDYLTDSMNYIPVTLENQTNPHAETHGYRRGTIDKTLFIKKDKKDIMLVQVYVDDIIFGSTRKSWCDEFEALMKGRFQMSSMGELIFFLGLQVKQKTDGIFISQDKYVADMLKKFDLANMKTEITPMEAKMALTKDEEADEVDVHLYRSMIGSLMYLTASRPDIMFAVCACSRFQVTPKTSHLNAVKRIFKYLKGKPNLGLWYPRESSFDLEAFSDSDYAGANLDRKSTTGGCQFLGSRLILWQCKKQTIVATSTTEAEYVSAASYCG